MVGGGEEAPANGDQNSKPEQRQETDGMYMDKLTFKDYQFKILFMVTAPAPHSASSQRWCSSPRWARRGCGYKVALECHKVDAISGNGSGKWDFTKWDFTMC